MSTTVTPSIPGMLPYCSCRQRYAGCSLRWECLSVSFCMGAIRSSIPRGLVPSSWVSQRPGLLPEFLLVLGSTHKSLLNVCRSKGRVNALYGYQEHGKVRVGFILLGQIL